MYIFIMLAFIPKLYLDFKQKRYLRKIRFLNKMCSPFVIFNDL